MEENIQKMKKVRGNRKLSKEQDAKIFRLISTRRPFQLGFKLPYKNAKRYLWTRDLLNQLIDQKLQVQMLACDVVNFLKRCNFPLLNRVDSKHEQCPKSIREWLDKNLATINARSKAENAKIYWVAEIKLVGLPPIKTSRNNRLTTIPVIENQGRVHWLTVKGEFDDEKQKMLLKSLVGQSNGKVFLIRNTVNHFKSPLVVNWLNDNKSSIEVFPPPEWINEKSII